MNLSKLQESHTDQLEELEQLRYKTKRKVELKYELEVLLKTTQVKIASLYQSIEESMANVKAVDREHSANCIERFSEVKTALDELGNHVVLKLNLTQTDGKRKKISDVVNVFTHSSFCNLF